MSAYQQTTGIYLPELIAESSQTQTDDLQPKLRREQKLLSRQSEHYRQIGQTLSVLEAAVWKVGIVAIFPTARILTRRSVYSGPLESFIREELSTVPTLTLEFYLEDLDDLSDDASSLDALSIASMTFMERTGLFLLFAPFVLILSAQIIQTQLEAAAAWLAALVPFVFYLGLVSILASDTYRRASFSIILGKEIIRRRGGDAPGASNLQICPT